ncbi:hypothetical protein GG344DRAFT_77132 [Lentinula edodes]|nr:hypothetical protein GG344DRAFT_77132 [Lentinula edodes]
MLRGTLLSGLDLVLDGKSVNDDGTQSDAFPWLKVLPKVFVTGAHQACIFKVFVKIILVFILTITRELNLSLDCDEYDEEERNNLSFTPTYPDDVFHDEEQELQVALLRVLRKYEKAPIDGGEEDFQTRGTNLSHKMDKWRRGYYSGKLELSYDDPEQM